MQPGTEMEEEDGGRSGEEDDGGSGEEDGGGRRVAMVCPVDSRTLRRTRTARA
jgi:hypothetical protein